MDKFSKVTFADDLSSEISDMTFQSDPDRSHDFQDGSLTSTDSDDLLMAVEAIMKEVYAFQGIFSYKKL